MNRVEQHKRLGFDFIGEIAVDLLEPHFVIIEKLVEVFDCNGEWIGSVKQEIIEDFSQEPKDIYSVLTTNVSGSVSKELALELLGQNAYSFNEYVYL